MPNTNKIPDYSHIYDSSMDILLELSMKKRKDVARELGLNYMQLTHMLPLIKEIATRKMQLLQQQLQSESDQSGPFTDSIDTSCEHASYDIDRD